MTISLSGCASSGGSPDAAAGSHSLTQYYGAVDSSTDVGGSGVTCLVVDPPSGSPVPTPSVHDGQLECPSQQDTGPRPSALLSSSHATLPHPPSTPALATPTRTSNVPPPPKPPATPKQPKDEKQFSWADTAEPLGDDACFDLVHGMSPTAALRTMYPHAATAVESDGKAEAWADKQPYRSSGPNAMVAYALARKGWTIVTVVNGFDCQPDTAALSKNGVAAAEYQNGDVGLSGFAWAVGGHIRSDFDPFYGPSDDTDHKPLPQAKGIPWAEGDAPYMAQAMLLIYRLTGFAVHQQDLVEHASDLAVGFLE